MNVRPKKDFIFARHLNSCYVSEGEDKLYDFFILMFEYSVNRLSNIFMRGQCLKNAWFPLRWLRELFSILRGNNRRKLY